MLLLCVAPPLLAAAGDDFYEGAYRRGLAHFQIGAYDTAIRELRIAAFGLIESPARFETAEAYVASAARRLQRVDDERLAVQKIVQAEHVERRFAALDIPAEVRGDVDQAAASLLSATDLAYLRSTGPVVPIARNEPRSMTITVPDPVATQPAPVPQPMPVQPRIEPPPQPQPEVVQPQPAPAQPQPQPRVVEPQPEPVPPQSRVQPQPQPVEPPPPPPPAPASRANVDAAALIAQGDQAITGGDLAAAQAAYASALQAPDLSHASLLKIGEGLYRARAFRDAVAAFDRLGGFPKGEEPYRYDYAVSLYEIGRYGAAKRELAAALPYIEVTPEVERYREKIEGAIE